MIYRVLKFVQKTSFQPNILEFKQVGNLLDVCKSTDVTRSTLLHTVSYHCRPEAQAYI